ncbi:MAG TPA: glycosyltransferase family 2 protein [Propionibacterium sp.]|nr:glycosyltransferase family 2 protein [Propionibacterium sp.]
MEVEEGVERNYRPLSVCLVTYNSGALMLDCLRPFRDRDESIRVRVWDNGSTDGTTPETLKKLKAARLIDDLVLSPDDPGWAPGTNQLIKRAGDDDILFLNPDARVQIRDVRLLQDAVLADPTIGIASPVVAGEDDIEVMSAGLQPRLWPLFTHYSGLSKAFPKVRFLRGRHLFLKDHSDEDNDVEWSSGAVLFVPRSTIDRVGLLSTRWFMYGEDIEYCQRVLDAGLRVRIVSAAKAYHAVGGSEAGAEDDLDLTDIPVEDDAVYAVPGEGIAPPADLTGMWGRHTYAYYVHQFRPNPVTRFAWRVVFSGGLASRALVRRIRSPKDPMAKKLLDNALAVW